MAIRQLIKRLAGLAFFHSPGGRRRLRQSSVILMLHRVLPAEVQNLPHRHALCISLPGFETLLRWLPRYFTCVPLEQALNPSACPDSKPALALSFDDGWRDNAEHAWPLLQRYETPASIFLSTDFIGTGRRFWWEAIGETIWAHGGSAPAHRLLDLLQASGQPLPPELANARHSHARSLALADFLESLKTLPPDRLQALADRCPPPPIPHAMDWDQVHRLERSGLVRFGPHGASHAILTQLADAPLREDLLRSQQTLARHCAQPLPVYCYPNGDHDERVRRAVATLGYRHALTTRPGLVGADSDPLALPRIDVSHAAARHPYLLAWRLRQGARAGAGSIHAAATHAGTTRAEAAP